ncbi:hypothetical protein [Acinetobacter bereziniae]|uniref:hypothetical protein n=1 Tax=Acinetobacter bereziniae TaxID=106648 RepID=UPI000B2A79FA|nr:hypothetical protein [Acinetobacter bereziniae]
MNMKLKIAVLAMTMGFSFSANADFKQAPLPYSVNALEPDARRDNLSIFLR